MSHVHEHFALSNFEGTLDFLLCLLQRDEIDIYDIPIQDILQQFIIKLKEMERDQLERGAEFIGSASYLIWLKSKMLLPSTHAAEEVEEVFEDPHFELIHHLIDYCHFKRAAKELSKQEEKQQTLFFRGVHLPEEKKPLGIDHISIDELSHLFQNMLQKASQEKKQILEEEWRVADKIIWIKDKLKQHSPFSFESLFDCNQSRVEMIVIFLALLELMKIGRVNIEKDDELKTLIVTKKEICSHD